MDKKLNINKVEIRILYLSPSVREGLEKECSKDDFFSEGENPIGKGGFGQVWKVRHKLTDKIYAIKVMNKQNIIEQRMVGQIHREVEIMYKMNHPHIIKLVNHFEDDEYLYLIMHYASKGQLFSLLKKEGHFDQRRTAQYMREVLSAVKYLHSFEPQIIHRDIKPENILLDENGRVKLADFGWSNYVDKDDEPRRTYCGTPEYLAPEMVKKEGHDTSIDIWALGVLMFELLCGKPPFAGNNQRELFSNIKKQKITWPDDFPPLAKNLISEILKQNPKERPKLDDILKHSWFDQHPLLRPVLIEQQLDERQWLELHMITSQNEKTKGELDDIFKNKRKSILERIRRLNNYNIQNKQNVLTNNTIEEKPILDKNEINNSIHQLNETIEKLKKENSDLKMKNEKNELEIKSLKSEIQKMKDPSLKTQEELQSQTLKNMQDKCNILNKDRIGLLKEIEEKSNEINNLKFKLKTLDGEFDTFKKNYNSLNDKYKEAKTQSESIELKLSEIRNQMESELKEKDNAIEQFRKKNEILKQKLLLNETSTFSLEQLELQSQNLIAILSESISEFKELFTRKTQTLQSYLCDIKDNSSKAEKEYTTIINGIHQNVSESIQKAKNSFEKDFLTFKQDKEGNDKKNEQLEWYKQQINELVKLKMKSSQFEIKASQLEKSLADKEKLFETQKNQVEIMEKLNKEKNNEIFGLKDKLEKIEGKLADIKDYFFRNFPDKLEGFQQWFIFEG